MFLPFHLDHQLQFADKLARVTMSAPSHRHQSSLEDIIDFSETHPIFENGQQRAQAVGRFRRIVTYFESEKTGKPQSASRHIDGFNRPALLRLTFEYARSPESQEKFLKAFFPYLALGMLDSSDGFDLDDDDNVASLREPVFSFADQLIYHFFLPCTLPCVCNICPNPPCPYLASSAVFIDG